MNNNYLDKVIEQIVSETMVDNDEGRIYTPFSPISYHFSYLISFLQSTSNTSPLLLRLLRRHCKDVYGLTETETDYVCDEYKDIINDKIDG